jgi:hypothetical protein
MLSTTETEAKAYIEKLSEYESQGYNLMRLREAKEQMLSDLKKTALALDIKNFSNSIWPSLLDETPLLQLTQYFYIDVSSVEEWAEAQIKGCSMTIKSDTDYINDIKAKKRLSADDKKTITFWEGSIAHQQNEIEKIKNAFMARNKTTPVKKEEPKKLTRDEMFRENVLASIKEHADLIKGILDDYLVTDGAELEIAQALTNLTNVIKTIAFEKEEKQELTPEQVIELANYLYEVDKIKSKDLLDFMVESEIVDYVSGRDFAFVKVTSMDQQNKLRAFVETEIWPYYNQQKENILI